MSQNDNVVDDSTPPAVDPPGPEHGGPVVMPYEEIDEEVNEVYQEIEDLRRENEHLRDLRRENEHLRMEVEAHRATIRAAIEEWQEICSRREEEAGDAEINITLSPEERHIIEKAAEVDDLSVEDFILRAVLLDTEALFHELCEQARSELQQLKNSQGDNQQHHANDPHADCSTGGCVVMREYECPHHG